MKKKNLYFGLAVLLIAAIVLAAGCAPSLETDDDYRPPEGMGSVRLNFSNEIARQTILPDDADIDSFLGGFTLEFTPTTPGVFHSEDRTIATRNNPVNLVPGTYTLEVTAFLTTADFGAGNAAAVGTATGIVISESTPATTTVVLRAYDPNEGTENGEFAWAITNSITGITAATMVITEIGGTVVDTITLVSNWGNSTALTEGFYYVDISLTSSAGTKEFRHILHIYRFQTSTFTYTFTNAHIGIITGVVTPGISYTHPGDNVPVLTVAESGGTTNPLTGLGTAASPYLLSIADNTYPDEATITVGNAGTFTGGVEYFSGSILLANGVITAGSGVFVEGGPYQVVVVGTIGATNGAPYSTEIYFEVRP